MFKPRETGVRFPVEEYNDIFFAFLFLLLLLTSFQLLYLIRGRSWGWRRVVTITTYQSIELMALDRSLGFI